MMPITSRYKGADKPNALLRSAVRYQSPMPTSARFATTAWTTAAVSTTMVLTFRHSRSAMRLMISPSTPLNWLFGPGIE
ncbi:hypothetical protein D9M71_412240 [compost metagenome]